MMLWAAEMIYEHLFFDKPMRGRRFSSAKTSTPSCGEFDRCRSLGIGWPFLGIGSINRPPYIHWPVAKLQMQTEQRDTRSSEAARSKTEFTKSDRDNSPAEQNVHGWILLVYLKF